VQTTLEREKIEMSDRECRLWENGQISERKEKQWRGGWKEERKEGGNKRRKAWSEERDKRVTKRSVY